MINFKPTTQRCDGCGSHKNVLKVVLSGQSGIPGNAFYVCGECRRQLARIFNGI